MKDDRNKNTKIYLKGAIYGAVIILLLYTAAAVFLTFKDLNDTALDILSLFICGIGGFCTAHRICRQLKCNGLKNGAIIGCVLCSVITLVGCLLGNSFSSHTILRLLTTVLCSGVGGIVGVNRSGKRKMI